MKDIYTKTRTNVYHINYHIVWCVKYRKPILSSEIADYLKQILQEVADEKGFVLHDCEVGQNDHVHIFVSAPPKISPSYIVKMMKGISGRKLFIRYPDIATKLYNGTIWNHSSFIETIGSTSAENIRKYIEAQDNQRK